MKIKRISQHAIDKFLKEKNYEISGKVESEILRLFYKAEEEKIEDNPKLVMRKLNYDFDESKYYRYKNWRFVVFKEEIITIEIDRFTNKIIGYVPKQSAQGNRRGDKWYRYQKKKAKKEQQKKYSRK